MRPGGAGKLAPKDLDDVDLDPDRLPVPVVRRTVGSSFEGADVAERAAVHAAHVRVQRPVEHHPLDPVEGALAGLFPVFDAHAEIIRTHVRLCRQEAPLHSGETLDDDPLSPTPAAAGT